MRFGSTQEVIVGAILALVSMPIVGFLGAVFLNWSRVLLESRPIGYWAAYKVSTLSSMAVIVFLVPLQFATNRLGSLGVVIDIAVSVMIQGIFFSRWIRSEDDRPIEVGDGIWLAVLDTALWLLVCGVFFGLAWAVDPKQTLWGTALAVVCAALLAGVATMSLRRPLVVAKTVPPVSVSWKTDDILALYRHAAEEFDAGQVDENLWALATIARSSPDQQRDWYLAERVKKLKEIAEEQLRREGIL